MNKIIFSLLFLFPFTLPFTLGAQSTDSLRYMPARELASNGDAAGGRAMVDSILGTIQQGSLEYAEGLYWRASLAETTQDAERDYRGIIVDYPLSPRVEDILLRLAQMEITRGESDAALRHLQRLKLEYPNGITRARASYWTARILLDKNDTKRGCAMVSDALSSAPAKDVELRNQISFLAQRCPILPVTNEAIIGANENPQPSVITSQDINSPITPPGNARGQSQPPEPSSRTTTKFTIQVAAFSKKSQAQALVASLKMRGYQARLDGNSSPYRVRIGRYNSRVDANAALGRLKAKKIDGFVVAG
jgi:hypothetical protein